jgi:hypothetical protein
MEASTVTTVDSCEPNTVTATATVTVFETGK